MIKHQPGRYKRLRLGLYARTSSDDQRDRETIKSQVNNCRGWQQLHDDLYEIVEEFLDDGVSGTIPIGRRPRGGALLRKAAAGELDGIIATRPDRLGRDTIDLMETRETLDALGIEMIGVVEPMGDEFAFDIHAVIAKHDRKRFLRITRDGATTAARQGRYVGGVVTLGFTVVAEGKLKFYALDDRRQVFGGWTPVDIVKHIFHAIGVEGRSCHQVATALNEMGAPTHHLIDGMPGGTGKRGKNTTNVWRPSRILKIVSNTMYKGVVVYRKRSRFPGAEAIEGPCPRVVSDELWQAVQEVVQGKRLFPATTARREYLLSGLLHCLECGSRYCGTPGQGRCGDYYRCNGRMRFRGPGEAKCRAKAVAARGVEPAVWESVEAYLRAPGELLRDLFDAEDRGEEERLRKLLDGARLTIDRHRKRVKNLQIMLADGDMSRAEYAELRSDADRELQAAQQQVNALDGQLAGLERVDPDVNALLAELRSRLDAGLSFADRQQILRLLVDRIDVTTDCDEDGNPLARCVVHYRFPAPTCVVDDCTGTDCDRDYTGRVVRYRRELVL